MLIHIRGAVLVKALKVLCKKSCKLAISLDVDSKTLYIQSFNEIVKVEIVELIDVIDPSIPTMSINIDMAWELIRIDEDVTIMTDKASMTIITDSLLLAYSNIYEEAIEIGNIGSEVCLLDIDDIDHFTKLAVHASRHCKTLFEEVPKIVVSSECAYFVLSDCAIVYPIKFPNCQIALPTMRELSGLSNRSNLEGKRLYKSESHVNSYIYTYTNDNVALFNVQDNITTVPGSINGILVTLNTKCSSSFEPIFKELMLAASKIYNKGRVVVQICSTGVSCQFTTQDMSSSCTIKMGVMNVDNTLVSIMCITDVLKLILNVVQNLEFTVKAGGRYVCLETSRFQLLLTMGVQG